MQHLYGVTVAMTTPFDKKGNVETGIIEELTNHLIAHEVNCLFPCGTTGEFNSLSVSERKQIAETVVETSDSRLPVFIHVGGDCEANVSELIVHAYEIHADGVGIVTPTFLGVTNDELVAYYQRLAALVPDSFPLYLYNIPQCAGNDIPVSVAETLSKNTSNIVGIKYSYPDINRLVDYILIPNFSVLHGGDRFFSGLLSLGAEGTISGCAGVFPEPFVALYKAWNEQNRVDIMKYQRICIEAVDLLRAGTNMAYFKTAQVWRGLPENHMRLPQLDLSEAERQSFCEDLASFCKKNGIERFL